MSHKLMRRRRYWFHASSSQWVSLLSDVSFILALDTGDSIELLWCWKLSQRKYSRIFLLWEIIQRTITILQIGAALKALMWRDNNRFASNVTFQKLESLFTTLNNTTNKYFYPHDFRKSFSVASKGILIGFIAFTSNYLYLMQHLRCIISHIMPTKYSNNRYFDSIRAPRCFHSMPHAKPPSCSKTNWIHNQ